MKPSLLFVALAALIVAPIAAAHGGDGGSNVYRSTLQRVQPTLPKMRAQVLGGDDRIRLYNGTGKTLLVFGYEGEPYLRFDGGKVYVNRRSPATYLNQDRYGQVTVPATANPKAAPSWSPLAIGRTYEWHDHRIHWMSTIAPRAVQVDPQSSHHVFDWRIPLRVSGEAYRLVGRLDYVPVQAPKSESPFPVGILAGALGGAVLISAAGAYFAVRRR